MKQYSLPLLIIVLLIISTNNFAQENKGNALIIKNNQELKEYNSTPKNLEGADLFSNEDEIGQDHTKAAPVNDDCSGAITLVSGAAQLCSQTTDGGGTQALSGEVIAALTVGAASNFNQTVWYKFVATSANMFVEWELTGLVSGVTWCPSNMSMVVYNSSTCLPVAGSIIATQSLASDGAIVINLTGLTVGNTYLIQVGYNDGAGCKVPIFCMRVGNSPNTCSCASPCAAGCGYATTPTVAEVVASCSEYVLNPVSDGGTTKTYCYTFNAINTTVSFSMIITSNCSGGNVTGLTWNIQTTACAGVVASGDITNLSASGLTIGTNYVLCYTYTIPSTCYHSSLYPYFVGASPLPIELISFYGDPENKSNRIIWTTLSETNNEYFTLEKSKDGVDFEKMRVIKGAGNSNQPIQYSEIDNNPFNGRTYYRLKQTDYDGRFTYSQVISVENKQKEFVIVPNPSISENGFTLQNVSNGELINIIVTDITGKVILNKEYNTETGNIEIKQNLSSGIYLIKVINNDNVVSQKLVID